MLPLTVTSRSLLVNDSDSLFRELIQDLLTLSYQSQELRAVLARQFGVSEPTYRVFMAICQLAGERGVSVGAVAKYLRVTGTFITREAGKLVRLGHVQKGEDPSDRRGVLLSITEQGRRSFAAFAPTSQMINDEMFGTLSVQQFRSLCEIVQLLVERAQRTILLSRRALEADDPARQMRIRPTERIGGNGQEQKSTAVRKV